MGKTPIPLIIWIDTEWEGHPEIMALREKGHEIWSISGAPSLILSSRAHWWHDKFWNHKSYLETALKKARARKKEAKT